jgi:SAM-dependent methyltransferase
LQPRRPRSPWSRPSRTRADTEFDRYEKTYQTAVDEAISFAGREHGFYLEAKARRLRELTHRHLGGGRPRALDVGCGPGLFDRHLGSSFELEGVDVSPAMVERARETNPQASYRVYDGRRLPYDDGRFDVSFAVCVLHHVDRPDRAAFLAETARVTRSGGLVAVFEHNPINPLTRRVVRDCAFDEGVELLGRRELERLYRGAGLELLGTEYLLFFPWRADALERRLTRLPLGAQYVVAGRKT